ncbi:MAG: zinc-binding dehydrogenase [Puniceicoccaceae bacterium]
MIEGEGMKALAIRKFGGPEVLELERLAQPRPGRNEVLIRVTGGSVNPIDIKVRSGVVPGLAGDFPWVPGLDFVGTVEALGEGVEGFQVGETVCGFGRGCAAEFAVAASAHTIRLPVGVKADDAAVLPVVGITAWEAVMERCRIQPGDSVLVHGGCGGVGHLAVQLAALAGGKVTATVSTELKAGLVRQLGAEAVVLYPEEQVEDYVKRCTAGEGFRWVIDTVGGENLSKSFAAVGPFGTVVTIAARATVDLSPLHAKAATLEVVFMMLARLKKRGMDRQGAALERLLELLGAGRLSIIRDEPLEGLESIADLHRRMESGGVIGKLGYRLASQGG